MWLFAFLFLVFSSPVLAEALYSSWNECMAHRVKRFSPIRDIGDATKNSEEYCRSLGLRPGSYQPSQIVGGNKDYLCESQVTFRCGIDGCSQSRPALTIAIDEVNSEYTRCKGVNCESYPMQTHVSGVFKIYEVPGSAGFLKVSTLDGSYVEVTSTLMTIAQNFGTCIRTQ